MPVSTPHGDINTYVMLSEDGTPATVGLEWPMAMNYDYEAVFNVTIDEECVPDPATGAVVCMPIFAPINLPYPSVEGVPFVFQSLFYNKHGHLPLGVYSVAHYDMHFYLVESEEVMAVTPGNCSGLSEEAFTLATKPIPAACFPSNGTGTYVNMGAVVPMMGNHLLDAMAPELQAASVGEPIGFDYTLIYGAYNGSITYIEPMITFEMLSDPETANGCIPLPALLAGASKAGYYPTTVCVYTNETSGMQRMELSELQWYDGGCEDMADPSEPMYYAPQSYFSPAPGAPPLPEECEYEAAS